MRAKTFAEHRIRQYLEAVYPGLDACVNFTGLHEAIVDVYKRQVHDLQKYVKSELIKNTFLIYHRGGDLSRGKFIGSQRFHRQRFHS